MTALFKILVGNKNLINMVAKAKKYKRKSSRRPIPNDIYDALESN